MTLLLYISDIFIYDFLTGESNQSQTDLILILKYKQILLLIVYETGHLAADVHSLLKKAESVWLKCFQFFCIRCSRQDQEEC